MIKSGRRRNVKSKNAHNKDTVETENKKLTDLTKWKNQVSPKENKNHLTDLVEVNPEVSVPSPDDAALPCSTLLGSSNCQNEKYVCEKKASEVLEKKSLNNDALQKKEKKQMQQLRNSHLTDYFPVVRRSSRKSSLNVMKDKQNEIEDAILSGKEEGFEVKHIPGKGRGVITKKLIKKGEFVLEYSGELIEGGEEAKKRESVYAAKENTGCYMYYFKVSNKSYCIDATKETNRLGRLVNHSRKGNLKTQPFVVQGCPHLVLFASRDIEPGEELCYDYGDRSKRSVEAYPWLAF